MVRLSYRPWTLCAHVVFATAALGYIAFDVAFGPLARYCQLDFCRKFVADYGVNWRSNLLTALLPLVYLVHALLALVALYMDERDLFNGRFWWAELGNVVCAALYFISQTLFYALPRLQFEDYVFVLYSQACLFFVSSTLWGLNAVQYLYVAYKGRRDHLFPNLHLLICGLSALGCWGYAVTSLWALIAAMQWYDPALRSSNPLKTISVLANDNQQLQVVVFLGFDVVMGLCAALCLVEWWRSSSTVLAGERAPLVGHSETSVLG